MEPAPFHNDLAQGPDNVVAFWHRAGDGVRIRVVLWKAASARGTILLFSGRTEYAEKYGEIAGELTEAGYSVITLDWRGQGLSDRVDEDVRLGHVGSFDDYQLDIAAVVEAAREKGCPEPWFLVAHSMGGGIGLRAVIEGLPVEKAVYSAPMWGFSLPIYVRPLPHFLPQIMRAFGLGRRIAPRTSLANYIIHTPFPVNVLTRDADRYQAMVAQASAFPEFALGGPSVDWVGFATSESKRLVKMPRPTMPSLTFLGSDEEIVSVPAIHKMHANWPSGELRIIEGARHELMMESSAARDQFLTESLAFFDQD